MASDQMIFKTTIIGRLGPVPLGLILAVVITAVSVGTVFAFLGMPASLEEFIGVFSGPTLSFPWALALFGGILACVPNVVMLWADAPYGGEGWRTANFMITWSRTFGAAGLMIMVLAAFAGVVSYIPPADPGLLGLR